MAGQLTTQLGTYRLLRRIGSGVRSEVFEADRVDSAGTVHRVAVKRLRPGTQVSPSQQAAGRIQDPLRPSALGWIHPNIVRVLDRGEDAGAPFVILELVDGYDLRAVLAAAAARGETLPLPLACHVVVRLLDALAFVYVGTAATDLPFVADVSLRRVMLTRRGVIKVVGPSKPRVLTPGLPPEALAYFSPEEVANRRGDERSALFTVGSCFHELVSGQSLFGRATSEETLRAIRSAPVPSIRTLCSEATFELEAALNGALAREADDRFPALADFRRAVEDSVFQAGLEVDSSHLAEWIDIVFAGGAAESRRSTKPPSQRPSSRHVHGRDAVIQDARSEEPISLDPTATRSSPLPPARRGVPNDIEGPADDHTVLMTPDDLAQLVRDSVVPSTPDVSGVVPHPRGGEGMDHDERTVVEDGPPLDALLDLDTTRPGTRGPRERAHALEESDE